MAELRGQGGPGVMQALNFCFIESILPLKTLNLSVETDYLQSFPTDFCDPVLFLLLESRFETL